MQTGSKVSPSATSITIGKQFIIILHDVLGTAMYTKIIIMSG